MRKSVSILVLISLLATMLVGCASKAPSTTGSTTGTAAAAEKAFPTKNISGIIQWGAGGGTDSLMRPLATLAEKKLGVSIVVENKTGGTGSIATKAVFDQAADGYTVLMGAENPQLYSALGIIDLTYADFEPVFLIGDETVGIVVGKNSKYKTFTDLINDAKANPDKIKLSTTGPGGLPWEVAAFINSVTGATFNQIPYDSDASARTAVLNGECDFTVAKVQSALEAYKAGDLKYLTMVSSEKVSSLAEIPLITEEYPDFAKFLPWGPFYGIFVKKGTDPEAIKTMTAAFKEAYEDPTYQEVLKNFNINPLGYSGDEASKYLKEWQVNTITSLYNSGAIKKSPADLGL